MDVITDSSTSDLILQKKFDSEATAVVVQPPDEMMEVSSKQLT
jgi:hypothetical protein